MLLIVLPSCLYNLSVTLHSLNKFFRITNNAIRANRASRPEQPIRLGEGRGVDRSKSLDDADNIALYHPRPCGVIKDDSSSSSSLDDDDDNNVDKTGSDSASEDENKPKLNGAADTDDNGTRGDVKDDSSSSNEDEDNNADSDSSSRDNGNGTEPAGQRPNKHNANDLEHPYDEEVEEVVEYSGHDEYEEGHDEYEEVVEESEVCDEQTMVEEVVHEAPAVTAAPPAPAPPLLLPLP